MFRVGVGRQGMRRGIKWEMEEDWRRVGGDWRGNGGELEEDWKGGKSRVSIFNLSPPLPLPKPKTKL